jgi:hypothetical protein
MKRETLNLLVTILTPILAVIIGGWLTMKVQISAQEVQNHSDANVAALKQAMTESLGQYETTQSHNSDIASLKDWIQRSAEKQAAATAAAVVVESQHHEETTVSIQQQNMAIQHLSDTLTSPKPVINIKN